MRYKHYVAGYLLNPRHEVSVKVIGCGGTGSQVLTALGRMNYALKKLGHIGLHVTAIDGDIVTEANCGRQLFAPQEIGRNKAEVLITKLNSFFGTSWECSPVMAETYMQFRSNIIISCVDNVKTRLLIPNVGKIDEQGEWYNRHNEAHDMLYWLDFGNSVDSGQVVLGTIRNIPQPKGKRGCVDHLRTITEMVDLKKVNEKNNGPSCSLAEALRKQDLFVNSTLANIGMALMWKMFTKGVLDIQGAYMNLETMKVNPIKIERV